MLKNQAMVIATADWASYLKKANRGNGNDQLGFIPQKASGVHGDVHDNGIQTIPQALKIKK